MLSDLVRIKHGWPFKSESFVEATNDSPIVVGVGNFNYEGGFRFDSTKLKGYAGDYPSEYELRVDDILLVMTCQTPGGEILGIPGRIPDDGRIYLHNQRLGKVLIRDDRRVSQDFLYWLFLTRDFNQHLFRSASGTKILHTAPSRIEEFSFLLPPLPEQIAIASVLSSLDDKIDLLHRQNKTLEAMAETLFRQWFVEEADEGWEEGKLGDVVSTNLRSITKETDLSAIRYLDTGSLTENRIDGYQFFDLADAPSRARRLVQHDDVLLSTVRPNQKHYGIVKHPPSDLVVSTGFCVITCDRIDPHFVYLFLTTDEMTEYLHSIAEGSTSAYPSLRPEDIERLDLRIPPTPRLSQFAELAAGFWEKIDRNHSQVRTLTQLRDTLLPKLMSGEVRVAV